MGRIADKTEKWIIEAKKADFEGIGKALGVDKVTVRLMRNRGLKTLEEMHGFLFDGLKDLPAPGLLPGTEDAVMLLKRAVECKKKIRIIGDYDIDGVCSTAILLKGLMLLGADCDYYIPHRINDGYGLNKSIILKAIDDGTDVLLTCDNGISAFEELKLAKEHKMTVIVTDHHEARTAADGTPVFPPADAIVNPQVETLYHKKAQDSPIQKTPDYPLHVRVPVCGAVVAWKVMLTLLQNCFAGKDILPEDLRIQFLELAALATVGDVMKLLGENRIIVREGLNFMNRGIHNTGLRMLAAANGLTGETKGKGRISSYHLGFVLGPAINAAGRLESADIALRLLMTREEDKAAELAQQLVSLNVKRKEQTENAVREAAALVEDRYCNDSVLVLFIPELHESLAGIVAGRIREKYNRPVIVLARGRECVKGSGRSVPAYDMFRKLCEADAYLLRYGGHPAAAGLSIDEKNVDAFRAFLNAECGLSAEDLSPEVRIDMAMPPAYVNERLIAELDRLEPFGNGNPKPCFGIPDADILRPSVLGKNHNALKFTLMTKSGFPAESVMFGNADEYAASLCGCRKVDALYYPRINEYCGRRSIQFIAEALRPAD